MASYCSCQVTAGLSAGGMNSVLLGTDFILPSRDKETVYGTRLGGSGQQG